MPDRSQQLKLISDEGFRLDDVSKSDLTIAFLSLRSAFRSWFATYQSFRWKFRYADPNFEILPDEGNGIDLQAVKQLRLKFHSPSYFEQYSETIFHFQHFFELIIKDILRKEHELLVSNAEKHPLILWKLINKEALTLDDERKLRSVEFSEALSRIVEYIKSNKIDNAKYGFVQENEQVLQKLNDFRNRLVHRGTFVLPYSFLDEFVGKYLLPAIVAILELPEYKKHEKYWKYDELTCGLDPINKIGEEFQSAKVDYKKVALLKELGRAAFQSPIKKQGLRIDRGDRKRAELLAIKEAEDATNEVYDVLICPVCGSKSLTRFLEFMTEHPDPDDPGEAWLETTYAQCFCCSFSLTNEINNAGDFGLDIDDYWLKVDLE